MVLDLVIIGLAITLMPLTLLAFLLTDGKPPRPHTAPSTAALVAKAILGAVLIWVGLRQRRRFWGGRQT